MNKISILFGNSIKLFISFIIYYFFCQITLAQTNSGDFINTYSIVQDLKVPVRIAIDNADNIFVTDAFQNCIVHYDQSMNFVEKIFVGTNPTSIAFGNNNVMFVGDCVNGKIYKRLPNGNITLIYSDTISPSSMAVGQNDELYVIDAWSKRVMVMNFSGNLLRTIGDGIFQYPTGIAFDRKNNRIIVAEHGGFGSGFNLHAEIRIFGISGNLISTFGGWGNTNGKFYRIQGLTVGRCGNIYVTDPFQGNISVFNEDGIFITKHGQWGSSLGQLNVPMDIGFNSHEKVFLASLNNSAIEVFNITDSLPSSTITSGNANICNGGSASIAINFTGAAPWTFTYTINGINPQTISNTYNNPFIINANIPGAYNVTALSDSFHAGHCFSNTTNVIINPEPTASIANVNASICSGENIDIPISFTGTAPWSFTYTIDSANPTTIHDIYTNPFNLHVNHAGIYRITSVTGGSCIGNAFIGSAIISLNTGPVATITSGNQNICDGSSANIQIQLTGNPPWTLSYTRNDQDPMTLTNIYNTPLNLTVSDTGTYKIFSLSDAHCNGSTFIGSTTITAYSRPTSAIVSNNVSICENDSAAIRFNLSGSSPWSLTYTINGLNPKTISTTNNQFTFYSQQPGKYEIASLSDVFCTGTNFTGSTIVIINPNPMVYLGKDTNICAGQSLPLNGGGNDYFLWNDMTSNKTITVSTSGIYSLIVTSSMGCQSVDSISVNSIPTPTALLFYSINNQTITFSNASSNANYYSWDFGDGTSCHDTYPIHHYASPGLYIIKLTATSLLCGNSTYTKSINIASSSSLAYGNTSILFNIYPNPTNGIVNVDIFNPKLSVMDLLIFNSMGQPVYQEGINILHYNKQINLSQMASGVYSVRLTSPDTMKVLKLILNY